MLELKVAEMSAPAGSRSVPESLLASATWYQVPANVAPEKSRSTLTAPALPSTPLVAVQESGSNFAFTTIVTLSWSSDPQILAAFWKTYRRWAPTVVPGFPPTG